MKSHSGIYITPGKNGGPILVKTFKQRLVTNSLTEAELLALVDGVKKTLPLLKILEELDFQQAMTVWQDTVKALELKQNIFAVDKNSSKIWPKIQPYLYNTALLRI
jgi:hypothetical protein